MIINISSGCREGDCPQKDLDELENELKEDPLANGTSLVKIEETFDDLTDDELPQPDTVFDQDNSSQEILSADDEDEDDLDGNGLNLDNSGLDLGNDLDLDSKGLGEDLNVSLPNTLQIDNFESVDESDDEWGPQDDLLAEL